MNHKSSLHASLVVAMGTLATSAIAQTSYRVVELPVRPLAVGTIEMTYAMAVDVKGKVLVWVDDDPADLARGEVCTEAGCTVVDTIGDVQFRAMNKWGVLVGSTVSSAPTAIRKNGDVTSWITEGTAHGVNSAAVTVGQTRGQKPFRYDASLTLLPTLGGYVGNAKAINDSGVIVGYSQLPGGQYRATQWVDAAPQDLGVIAGGTQSRAHAINSAGHAVGCSDKQLDTKWQAVKYRAGTVVQYSGALTSCAFAINKNGVAVGEMETAAHPSSHAFVTDGRKLVSLHTRISVADQAKYELLWASGINNAGQIAVTAVRQADGATVALRLDPQL